MLLCWCPQLNFRATSLRPTGAKCQQRRGVFISQSSNDVTLSESSQWRRLQVSPMSNRGGMSAALYISIANINDLLAVRTNNTAQAVPELVTYENVSDSCLFDIQSLMKLYSTRCKSYRSKLKQAPVWVI